MKIAINLTYNPLVILDDKVDKVIQYPLDEDDNEFMFGIQLVDILKAIVNVQRTIQIDRELEKVYVIYYGKSGKILNELMSFHGYIYGIPLEVITPDRVKDLVDNDQGRWYV